MSDNNELPPLPRSEEPTGAEAQVPLAVEAPMPLASPALEAQAAPLPTEAAAKPVTIETPAVVLPTVQPMRAETGAEAALSDAEVERRIRRMSRRSFLWGAAGIGAGYFGWRWLITRPDENGIPWPFRRALEINEDFAHDYFQGYRLAPTFERSRAVNPRLNGDIGMAEDFDPSAWKLQLVGMADLGSDQAAPETPAPSNDKKSGASAPKPGDKKETKSGANAANPATADSSNSDKSGDSSDGSQSSADNSDNSDNSDSSADSSTADTASLTLTLADIKKLKRVEIITELKCIEGWSVIVQWAGASFADFAAKYPPPTKSGDAPDVKKKPQDLVDYVSLETPDGGYYVGLDMASALHPQTLLCYEMNGKPLPIEHGGPLRLVIPVKYGIKNIKRIGTIRYLTKRPSDYWAEQGYDWYAGH